MKKEIVISEADDLAIVFEQGRAAEFVLRQGDQLVGDIVLGKVESVVPAIEAAFINIGHDKNGFIHVADLPTTQSPRRRPKPQPIRTGEKLLIQIAKAPTGTKGARLTGRLSVPGRYLVFVPHDNRVCLSRMITDSRERDRLRRIATELKDPGHGLIVRTEAVGCTEDELRRDIEELIERWTDILHSAQTKAPPALLYRDNDLLTRVLRDRLTSDTERIVVDSQDAFQRAKAMLTSWMPEMVRNLTLHRGRTPILEHYRVRQEMEQILKPRVSLPSGGSIVIEVTEALTVIDVNSGKLTNSRSLAETVLKTNLEAAAEVARQIRLRDIGGIIIVDFISMDAASDQQKVVAAMNEAIKADKSRPQISPQFSEHGLMELSRRRQGQSLLEMLTAACETCGGLGRVRNAIHAGSGLGLVARPSREAEVADVADEVVEEILTEPIVLDAPAYPSEGPREDLASTSEERGGDGTRRRRRRRRRGRGRGPNGAAAGGDGERFESDELEGDEESGFEGLELEELEEAPAPRPVAEPAPAAATGFVFETVELGGDFEAAASDAERPAREFEGGRDRGRDRGDRDRDRRRGRGRDRDRDRDRDRGRDRDRDAGRIPGGDRHRPAAAAVLAQPVAPAVVEPVVAGVEGPSPWGDAALPPPATASVAEGPLRVFRPRTRTRPRTSVVEVAPGVLQVMDTTADQAVEAPVAAEPVAPEVAPAPEVEVVAAAPEVVVESAVEAEPAVAVETVEAPGPRVSATPRRRPVRRRSAAAVADETTGATEGEAVVADAAPVEVSAPSAIAELPAVPSEPAVAGEGELPADAGAPARKAPARRRSTRSRKTQE